MESFKKALDSGIVPIVEFDVSESEFAKVVGLAHEG
jgi:hypothetical protein